MLDFFASFLPEPLRQRMAPNWRPYPVVAVVRLQGTIGTAVPLRGGIDLASVAGALEAAFSLRSVKAVALAINSPGGSPVQSSLIFKRIRALAEEKSLPVYAFAEDVAASGGYMLACAADEIFADESSILGSIGVVSAGFGFTGLIEKLGVERRVHTAGESKAMLDPFRPENPEDVKRLEALQADVHENFKGLVRARRGARLAEPTDALFTGEFWAGREAKARGLIDGIGDLRSVMRARFGDKVRLRVVGGRRVWQWRSGFSGRATSGMTEGLPARLGAMLAAGLAEGVAAAMESRSLWRRFGL